MMPYRPEIGQRGFFQWIKATPEDGRRREMWERMFGRPEVVRPKSTRQRRDVTPPWAPAPAAWAPPAAAIPADLYGRGNPGHPGIWWGLAIPALALGGLIVAELSGVTNLTGSRRTA